MPGLSSDDLADRMMSTYKVAFDRERQHADNGSRLNATLVVVAERAPLYLRKPIPLHPPRLLLTKILRRFVAPFLMPQVEYNESVRDAFLEVRHQLDDSRAAREAMQERLDELERLVEALAAPMDLAAKPDFAEGPDGAPRASDQA